MEIAKIFDVITYGLVAAAAGIIVLKILELWFPHKLKESLVASAFKSEDLYLLRLERGLALLGVIASSAPFIGLMGTVLHIMDALSHIGTSLDTSIISGPIAVALNSTLVGLASAVPASIAHALFTRRIDVLLTTNQKS